MSERSPRLQDEIRETVTQPLLPEPALNAAHQIAPVQHTVKASGS